jgi:hypothetical protein
MKPKINALISSRKEALKSASPRSRDRLRYRLHVLLKAQQIKKEVLIHISTERSSKVSSQASEEFALCASH